MSATNSSEFIKNYFEWPIERRGRMFRVFVVEPGRYKPIEHTQIFQAAITHMLFQPIEMVDPLQSTVSTPTAEQFDLITFPEAFLPSEELISSLKILGRADSFGCVHVGLRPSQESNHLFKIDELKNLLDQLRAIPEVEQTDLQAFSTWLGGQNGGLRFNVGCLFTMDATRKLRVCLHPKLLASVQEVSPLAEENMAEANLLSAVTLRPTNKKIQTITLQPLLCSDALHLDAGHAGARPLEAMQINADCLGDNPPDHIDIVSVATCTRQVQQKNSKGIDYREWHQEFRSTFVRAASDDALARHRFAAFVLSNFRTIAEDVPAGLSGGFLPVPVVTDERPDYILLSSYGRPKGSNGHNRWSSPDDDSKVGNWSSRGYIASLNPFDKSSSAAARMVGFTIHRLPRDVSLWREAQGFADYTLKTSEYDKASASLVFVGKA